MTARTPGRADGAVRARRGLGGARLAIAAIEIVALLGNYAYVAGLRFFATANFFSYFTIQSAFGLVVVLLISAAYAFLAREDPGWLGILRTIVTIYVVISGIVFGVLAANAASQNFRFEIPWSDTLLHFVVPAFVLGVWLVDAAVAVHPPLPWSTLGWVLVFPPIWLVYTLRRGAELGWYPYFFLDETQVGGPAGVVLYCALVLVIFLVLTTGFTALHRMLWRRARDRRARSAGTSHRRALPADRPALRR